jgi:hypothetical protein
MQKLSTTVTAFGVFSKKHNPPPPSVIRASWQFTWSVNTKVRLLSYPSCSKGEVCANGSARERFQCESARSGLYKLLMDLQPHMKEELSTAISSPKTYF